MFCTLSTRAWSSSAGPVDSRGAYTWNSLMSNVTPVTSGAAKVRSAVWFWLVVPLITKRRYWNGSGMVISGDWYGSLMTTSLAGKLPFSGVSSVMNVHWSWLEFDVLAATDGSFVA